MNADNRLVLRAHHEGLGVAIVGRQFAFELNLPVTQQEPVGQLPQIDGIRGVLEVVYSGNPRRNPVIAICSSGNGTLPPRSK